tara:strand:- start:155 stop:430 length:276 start_codon:yes stop_codon:yes gene_type:complete
MPKQIYEINSFSAGIVSNPKDELDIPYDAATLSLNIDPLNNGELKGVPDVQVLKTTGFTNEFSEVSYVKPSSTWVLSETPVANDENAPSLN